MLKRLIQLVGFLISSLGWLFVLCTLAMEHWRITQMGGTGGSYILKVAWYWSSLWQDCYTDSTSITNCKDFPVLWSVSTYVQGVRGLLLCGITLGFFGAIFCFVGMECTYIGGQETIKDKILLAGSISHFIGGLSALAAYCLYINRIARTTFSPTKIKGILRYDIGPPIFLGLVGSFLIMVGAIIYAATVFRTFFPKRAKNEDGTQIYIAPRSGTRTLYNGYFKPSSQYSRQQGSYIGSGRSSSYQLSKISQTTLEKISERDAFV